MAMRVKKILALIYIIVAMAVGFPWIVHSQPAPRAIVVAWDGAVSSFVSELLQQGRLPNLAKLIQGGAFADNVIPVFPSKTAPGFASLWTGAPPRVTGISGNRVPRTPLSQFTILESTDGYNGGLLRAEPLWASGQRAGLKSVTIHIPFGWDNSGHEVHIQGYQGIAGREGIVTSRNAKLKIATGWENLPTSNGAPLEISFNVGATPFFGLFVGDPADPQSGYDTLLVTTIRNGRDIKARLKAGVPKSRSASFWSGVIELKNSDGQETGTYMRLFDLKPDGSDFLLYFTRPAHNVISPAGLAKDLRAAAGVFIGNGASYLYRDGAFGRTIPNGGNGVAEARYLETVTFVQNQLVETNRWALQHLSWNLFLTYTPFPDEAEHVWRGHMDSTLPGYRQDIADRLRPFLEEVYRISDEFLGLFLAQRPNNTIIALISDHGMQGVNKLVSVNRVLQQHGLLATDEQGHVDLRKTKAFYPPSNNGYILINSLRRKNGIVSPKERPEIVRQVRAALSDVRDGDRLVVTQIVDADETGEPMGIGGDAGGDVYIDLLPGYDFDAARSPGKVITQLEPIGNHGFNPLRLPMRTLMVLNGPGIAAGQRLQGARLIDFAPTLAKLLRIPAPKNATGKVLEESFAKPH
jgi:predicted AlkP superfamily phosphohydrolase/phosphomutase